MASFLRDKGLLVSHKIYAEGLEAPVPKPDVPDRLHSLSMGLQGRAKEHKDLGKPKEEKETRERLPPRNQGMPRADS